MKTDCELERSLGITSVLKSLAPKSSFRESADSGVYGHYIASIASTENNVWASFLVHQVSHTSAMVLRYLQYLFMQFSLHFESPIVLVMYWLLS